MRDRKIIIFAVFLIILCSKNSVAEFYGQEKQHKQLIQEIHTLNLLNGLYLTDEQLRAVLDNVNSALALQEKYSRDAENYFIAYNQSLENLKTELKNYKGEIPLHLTKEFNKQKETLEGLKQEYDNKIGALAKNIEKTLSSTQLYLVDTFKPCIIPPKGEARIGQAEGAEGIEKRLDGLRLMDKNRYNREKYEAADKMIERYKQHRPKGMKFDQAGLKKKLIAIFDRVRVMPENDFMIQQSSLAKEIKDLVSPAPPSIDLAVKIERYFFNQQAKLILAEKISNSDRNK